MQSVIEIQFLPPIPAIALIFNSDKVLFENEENYQKRTYRNRCKILSANGPEIISIPLQKGKNEQQNIKDVIISYDQAWEKKLITKIKSAYGKSPYYEHYSDSLFQVLSKRYGYLIDLNFACLSWTMNCLQSENEVLLTKVYEKTYPNETCDLRNVFSPLKKDGKFCNLEYAYPQVFEHKFNFIPDLSILDMLFNCGPESSLILDSIFKKALKIIKFK